MGNSDLDTTRQYLNPDDTLKRKAVKRPAGYTYLLRMSVRTPTQRPRTQIRQRPCFPARFRSSSSGNSKPLRKVLSNNSSSEYGLTQGNYCNSARRSTSACKPRNVGSSSLATACLKGVRV